MPDVFLSMANGATMNFIEALAAVEAGKMIHRESSPVIVLQNRTVALLTGNWLLVKFPLTADVEVNCRQSYPVLVPWSFSDEEMAATDWKIYE